MKEITSIMNVQITTIGTFPDDKVKEWEENRKEYNLAFLDELKKMTGCDNFLLLDEKTFIRDVEGKE